MGKSQRNKGRRGEIRARNLLREIYPDAYCSCNQAGSDKQPDVDGTPWWVEAKEQKTHRIWAAVRQAVDARDAAGDDRPIVVISHRTNGMTLAVVPMGDFLDEFGMHALNMSSATCVTGKQIRWERLVKEYTAVTVKLAGSDPPHSLFVCRAVDFVEELLKR